MSAAESALHTASRPEIPARAPDCGRVTLAYRIQRQCLTLVRPTALFTASRRILDL